MDSFYALDQILPAFQQYYTIKKEDVTPPFCAEAEFRSHNEQYFLVRSAHIADIEKKYRKDLPEKNQNDLKPIEKSNQESAIEGNTVESNASEKQESIDENLICPRCGKQLVLRTAKKGTNAGQQFYGCSGFPNCRYIRNT